MSRLDEGISAESSGEEGAFVLKRRRPRRSREQRRLRLRRRGRRAYIRSGYFLPSLATLGNAV